MTVWLDGTLAGTTAADAEGNWTFVPASDLQFGDHFVSAVAVDAAGNTSLPSDGYTFRIPQRSHYGLNCSSAPAFPTAWALLTLAWALGRRRLRAS